jgi:hypothetical protein
MATATQEPIAFTTTTSGPPVPFPRPPLVADPWRAGFAPLTAPLPLFRRAAPPCSAAPSW